MSNIRVLDPTKIRPNMRPVPPQQDLQLGQMISAEETRAVMLGARRMQAQAIARFIVSCARWLRGNPDSRVRRISDSMSVAGR
jgi:hypothetical protein